MHGHRHHGGGQVLQVASQRLAQGVHIEGLRVAQGPICQGTEFPWVMGIQLTAPVLPAPTPDITACQPASYRGTRQPSGSQAAHSTLGSIPCTPEINWVWEPRQGVEVILGALSPAAGTLGMHDSGESLCSLPLVERSAEL